MVLQADWSLCYARAAGRVLNKKKVYWLGSSRNRDKNRTGTKTIRQRTSRKTQTKYIGERDTGGDRGGNNQGWNRRAQGRTSRETEETRQGLQNKTGNTPDHNTLTKEVNLTTKYEGHG